MNTELQQRVGKHKKISNRSHRAGEYNNGTEKYTRGLSKRLNKVEEIIS